MINWNDIREEWENTNITLLALSKKYDLKLGTIKSRKSRENWIRRDATLIQKDASLSEEVASQPASKSTTQPIARKFKPKVKLTDKQQLFVTEYLRDFNATRSAMAVGYSKKTAHTSGWMMLRNDEVQAEIQRQKALTTAQLGLDIQRVITELMKIAFADISDVMEYGIHEIPVRDEDGDILADSVGNPILEKQNFVRLKNEHEIDGTVISEIKQTRVGVSVKLHDKLRAIEKLERYLPYMTEEEKLKVEKTRAEITLLEAKGF